LPDSIKAARLELAQLLKEKLPNFDVFPTMENLDEIQVSTLQLRRTRIAPDPAAPLAQRQHTVELQLVLPTETSDDTLDDALDEVLDALHELRVTWSSAERRNWADKPAYVITITTASSWARPTG
jgi:hypothetical protein